MQRITIPEILNDEWFKKEYKPPQFEQHEDVNLYDVDSVFNYLIHINNLISFFWSIEQMNKFWRIILLNIDDFLVLGSILSF